MTFCFSFCFWFIQHLLQTLSFWTSLGETKWFISSETQLGFPYSPIRNWVAYGIVNIKCCFHKELKPSLSLLEAKREINYCIKLQNGRHKKEITVEFFKWISLRTPRETHAPINTCLLNLTSRAYSSEGLANRGFGKRVREMGVREESLKKQPESLARNWKLGRMFLMKLFCCFKAISMNEMFTEK